MKPVRVLLAPDSFKGTMSALTVAEALAEGVRAAGAEAVLCPLADGGEGTSAILHAVLGGEIVERTVTGPLGAPVTGFFLLTNHGRTAVLDTATASGLDLVPAGQRDAEAATSTGTGQLLAAAAATGAETILLGVGGSACTDGGAGALAAITAAGGLRDVRLRILCDVQTRFEDAGRVYGPQKGADDAAVQRLTARLHALAERFPRDPRGKPRTGAAGGLSGALWAVHQAELVSGIETVLDAVGFTALLASVDLVITGEGRLDAQTVQGKVVSGVTGRCARSGTPVWAVVGQSRVDPAQITTLALTGVTEAGEPAALRVAATRITAALSGAGHA